MIVTEYKLRNVEIRVYRPELSDEKREQRERQIETALQLVGKSIVETRRDTNGDNDKTRNIAKE